MAHTGAGRVPFGANRGGRVPVGAHGALRVLVGATGAGRVLVDVYTRIYIGVCAFVV